MASEGMTVFVVEDDDAVRDSLKLLLESHGMRVEDYSSTSAFVRAHRPAPRQCLILDQHLPGMTGLDFLSSAQAAKIGMPVILVTGRGDGAIRTRAKDLGVAAYLEKPIDEAVLIAAIKRAVEAES